MPDEDKHFCGLLVLEFDGIMCKPSVNWTMAAILHHSNLIPRVSHLTALWGERGETLVWFGHVLL